MATGRIDIFIEATPKKAFARAIDWPGWARSGKTAALALEALAAYQPRYAEAAKAAGVAFSPIRYEVVEETGGGGGTDFGVPSVIADADRRPVTAAEAKRLAVQLQEFLMLGAAVELIGLASGALDVTVDYIKLREQ